MKSKKMKIDITQLEPIDELDEEELAIHRQLKSGHFELDSSKKTIHHYAEIFKENNKQRKVISLRMPKQDYFAIKSKALELGMPYQALINSVVHRYVMGAFRESIYN